MVKSTIQILLLFGTFLQIHTQYQGNFQFGQPYPDFGVDASNIAPNPNQIRNEANFPWEKVYPNIQPIFAEYQQVEVDVLIPEKPERAGEQSIEKVSFEKPRSNVVPRLGGVFPQRNDIFGPRPLNLGQYDTIPRNPFPEQITRTQFQDIPKENPFLFSQGPQRAGKNFEEQRNPVSTFWFILPLLKNISPDNQDKGRELPVLPESRRDMENHLLTHEERMKTFLGFINKVSQNLDSNQETSKLAEANPQGKKIERAVRLLKFLRCLIQMKKRLQEEDMTENNDFQSGNLEQQLNLEPISLFPSPKIDIVETPKHYGRPIDRLVEEYHKQKLEDQNTRADSLQKLHHLYHQRKMENAIQANPPMQKPQDKVLLGNEEEPSGIFKDFQVKLHDLYQKQEDDFVTKLGEIYLQEKIKTPEGWPNFQSKEELKQAQNIRTPKLSSVLQTKHRDNDKPGKAFVRENSKFDEYEKQTIKEHLGAPILKLEIFPKKSEEQGISAPKNRPPSRLDKLFQEKSKEDRHKQFHSKINELSTRLFGDTILKSEELPEGDQNKKDDSSEELSERNSSEDFPERNSSETLSSEEEAETGEHKNKLIQEKKSKEQSSKMIKVSNDEYKVILPKKTLNTTVKSDHGHQQEKDIKPIFKGLFPNKPKEIRVKFIENGKSPSGTPISRSLESITLLPVKSAETNPSTSKLTKDEEEESTVTPAKVVGKLVALKEKLEKLNGNNKDLPELAQPTTTPQSKEKYLKTILAAKDQKVEPDTIYKFQKDAEAYQKKQQKIPVFPKEEITTPKSIEEKINQLSEQYKKQKLEETYGSGASNLLHLAKNGVEGLKLKILPLQHDSNIYWKDTSGLALKTKFLEDESPIAVSTPKPIDITRNNPLKLDVPKVFNSKDSQTIPGGKEMSKKVPTIGLQEEVSKKNFTTKEEAPSSGIYEDKVLERTIHELPEKNSTKTDFKPEDKITTKDSKIPGILTSPTTKPTIEKRPTSKDPFLSALKIEYEPTNKSRPKIDLLDDDDEEEDDPTTKSSVFSSLFNLNNVVKKLKYNFGTENLRSAQAEKKKDDGRDFSVEEDSSEDPGTLFTSFPFQLLRNLF